MVLKHLARVYEGKRQSLNVLLMRGRIKGNPENVKDQLKEVEGILEELRSGKEIKTIFDGYKKRVSVLMKDKSKRSAVQEIRNFLQAIIHEIENDSKKEVNLKSEKIEWTESAESKAAVRDYQHKIKPLIDDFLEEGY